MVVVAATMVVGDRVVVVVVVSGGTVVVGGSGATVVVVVEDGAGSLVVVLAGAGSVVVVVLVKVVVSTGAEISSSGPGSHTISLPQCQWEMCHQQSGSRVTARALFEMKEMPSVSTVAAAVTPRQFTRQARL